MLRLTRWLYRTFCRLENLKFFLPLCGKAGDLIYLYEKGATVYGVEVVEKAIKELFAENDLKYTVTEVKGVPTFSVSCNRHYSFFTFYWAYSLSSVTIAEATKTIHIFIWLRLFRN